MILLAGCPFRLRRIPDKGRGEEEDTHKACGKPEGPSREHSRKFSPCQPSKRTYTPRTLSSTRLTRTQAIPAATPAPKLHTQDSATFATNYASVDSRAFNISYRTFINSRVRSRRSRISSPIAFVAVTSHRFNGRPNLEPRFLVRLALKLPLA